MKKTLRLMMLAVIAMSVTFISCKKTDSSSDASADLATHADDQSRVSTESDAVANDANTAIESYGSYEGRPNGVTNVICDATTSIDSSNGVRSLTITYNGANCSGNRTRTGVVVVSIPLTQHWRDAGAVLTVDIQNLKITRVRDNKSITINGTHTITNVSGGRLVDLATLGTVTHTITSSNMVITFDNGTQRTWQVSKQRVFTYNNGVVITTTGTHTDGATSGISEWGTNRFGNNFVSVISQPMVVREDCDWRLVSGEISHERLIATVVVDFGLDSTGAATTCPGTGTYYFKVVWTGVNGIVRTYILPY